MPGHMDGIDCMVSFNVGSIGPFNGTNKDWAQLEEDIRRGLGVRGHRVRDVNVFHMHAAGVSIGKVATALAAMPRTRRAALRLVAPGTNRAPRTTTRRKTTRRKTTARKTTRRNQR